ncbi:hypothetical protein [Paenibacillus oralis]|uniref:hypothetical protein n=1 Tax=Paenibacillus oralis TaxID=2490856 RepID=UPI001FEA227B|nr:hypothetical protein [Paenibacillus oralis]
MRTSNTASNSIEKAFSSYIKTCLQHAKRDYVKKLQRDSAHLLTMDAVTFEVTINTLANPYNTMLVQYDPSLTQILGQLQLTKKRKRNFIFEIL